MRKTLIMTAALLFSATSVQAQILGGGGGLGGTLGGSFGGVMQGGLGGLGGIDSNMESVATTTRSAARGGVDAGGNKSIDRRSGRASANGMANANGEGSLAQTIATPTRSIDATGSGSAGASKSGSVDAQLIGTDQIGSTAGALRAGAQNAVGDTREQARGAIGQAGGAGHAAFVATGSAATTGSTAGLALAGSAMASAAGTFDIARGTTIFALDGERIGKVSQVIADQSGRVQQLLVKVDGQKALLPAGNFSANGELLMSAMGEAQIKQLGEAQEEVPSDGGATHATKR